VAQRELSGHPDYPLPARAQGRFPPSATEDLQQWGQRLRLRREASGLTRRQLASLAGVADSTIRNLETGRHRPTRSIVTRLQAVARLGLPMLRELGPREPGTQHLTGEPAFAGNCWLAPDYDALQLARDLIQRCNSAGGQLDQSFLYTDHASAAAYCALTAQPSYVKARLLLPIDELAQELLAEVGNLPCDVIGLGAGEAKDEVRLVQALRGDGESHLRLFLLDLSQPLLGAGYRQAASVLAELPGVDVVAIQGNFHHLPRYTPLFASAARRRVLCMFGHTFGTLENELGFVRHSLGSLASGDLFLLTVALAVTPPAEPEPILPGDPELLPPLRANSRQREGLLYEFLVGPFTRYVRGLTSIALTCGLDREGCPVPRSYAVHVRAHVKTAHGPERVFSLGAASKHYDPEPLRACLGQLGWGLVKLWRYAEAPTPGLLLLFKKTGKAP
jgi:transcriptional regulator with XRE-family HTH domain